MCFIINFTPSKLIFGSDSAQPTTYRLYEARTSLLVKQLVEKAHYCRPYQKQQKGLEEPVLVL